MNLEEDAFWENSRDGIFLFVVTISVLACYISDRDITVKIVFENNRKINTIRKGAVCTDKEMLRQFYQRYSGEIYLYLYSLCRNRDIAQDMMQEVFLKAMLSWQDGSGNLRAWLYKVARNTCFNYMRRNGREEAYGDEIPRKTCGEDETSPLDIYLRDERRRLLYEGMLTLPIRQREILELYYFSEMNIKEIAVVQKLSPENVRVLTHRARKALKEYMEVNGYEL